MSISDQTHSHSHRTQTEYLISTYRAGNELPTNNNAAKEFIPQLTVSSQPKSNLVHVVLPGPAPWAAIKRTQFRAGAPLSNPSSVIF